MKCPIMKCFIYEMSYLWIVLPWDVLCILSMKWLINEMSYLWNVLSMKCPIFEMSNSWNVLYMKCPIYEMSYLWNVLSMKCPIYEISDIWNVLFMILLFMKFPCMKCLYENDWHMIRFWKCLQGGGHKVWVRPSLSKKGGSTRPCATPPVTELIIISKVYIIRLQS